MKLKSIHLKIMGAFEEYGAMRCKFKLYGAFDIQLPQPVAAHVITD